MSQSMKVAMADGMMTSDNVRKNQVIERVVWRNADFLSVGTKMLPTKNYPVIDVANSFPGNLIGNYPLAPGAKVQMERVSWTPYGYTLYKFEARWSITGEGKIRQAAQQDQQAAVRRVQEALAFWKDKDILDKVIAGTYATNTVTVGAGSEWNSGGATVDIEKDVITAWNNLISNGYTTMATLNNLKLVVPAPVYGNLQKLQLIGNVQQRLSDYFSGNYQITILPTLYTDAITHPPGSIYTLAGSPAGISDDAYLVVNAEDTGEHGVYTGGVIPPAYHKDLDDGGEEWVVRQLFGTKIQPNSSTDATNVGIAKISNVC